MDKVKIEVNDREFSLVIAKTEDEKTNGLSGTTEFPEGSDGMLFDYSEDPQTELVFNTVDMNYPIDIIFVNQDNIVAAVEYGEPKSEDLIECIADEGETLIYVIETSANSGIKVGDEVEFDDDSDEMYMLDENGQPVYTIKSGARIFSRIHTRKLIRAAKKAKKSKDEKDYKKLGKLMFKILDVQDNQESEYVELPETKQAE
jgi:uncharacterized membrane protein (UPF0127 family)